MMMTMTATPSAPPVPADLWRYYPHSYAMRVSQGEYRDMPHLRWMSAKLQQAAWRRDPRNLEVNMPPGHGKSLLTCVWFPLWLLSHNPYLRILVVTYGSSLSEEFGSLAGSYAVLPDSNVPIGRSPKSNAIKTKQRGGVLYTGKDGSILGKHFDVIIMDDLTKTAAEAFSPTHQRRIQGLYQATLRNRLRNGGFMVNIGHRWRKGDFFDWLSEEEPHGWDRYALAVEALPGDPLGRAVGEPLAPSMIPPERFAVLKRSPFFWHGQWQQHPVANIGSYFNPDQFLPLPDILPHFHETCVVMDTAYSEGEGRSYSAAALFGVDKERRLYLLDLIKDRLIFSDLLPWARRFVERHQPGRILIENKATGISLIQEFERLRYRNIERLQPGVSHAKRPTDLPGSKEMRATLAAPHIAAGRLFVDTSAQWFADYISVMSLFPSAGEDDVVDLTTSALLYYNHPDHDIRRSRITVLG
jgi:predicted phage terminase large subunit-like protein